MRASILLAAALASSLLASCGGVECGPGTFADGDTCIGFDPDDTTPPTTTVSPAGGRSREPLPSVVTLTTDEPATIFYSTDGTVPDPATSPGEASPVTIVGITQGMTVTYLAVDRAGNQTEVETATYESDLAPPPAVTDLTVTLAGTIPTVRWTHPAGSDHAGVVVARIIDAIDGHPTPGMTSYSAGQAITSSVQVVAAGPVTELVDTARPPGPVRYAVWTRDDLGNYSRPVAARAAIPLGPLTATLTYDATAGTLTAGPSAGVVDVAASTATRTGTTLTISLAVRNRSSEHFANPKIAVGVTGGAFVTGADGVVANRPYRRLAPLVLAPGATDTRPLVLGNVTDGSTITLALELVHDPLVTSMHNRNGRLNAYDLRTSTVHTPLAISGFGPNDRVGGKPRPALRTGGRYLDVPTSHASIERFDLVTGTSVRVATLASIGQRANVIGLVPVDAGMIAVVKRGGHRGDGAVELVRLDEALVEIERVPQPVRIAQGFRRVVRSPDGTTIGMPVTGGIQLFDVATLSAIDGDPISSGINPVATTLTSTIAAFEMLDGGDLIAIGRHASNTAKISLVRRGPSGYSATDLATIPAVSGINTKALNTAVTPDGRVWLAFSHTLRVFDPDSNQLSTVGYAPPAVSGSLGHLQGVNVIDGQLWLVRGTRTHLDQIDPGGAIQRTITLASTAGVYGHWLGVAR